MKKSLVIIFWIVGTILVGLASKNLLFDLPQIDARISDNQERFDVYSSNVITFKLNQGLISTLSGELNLLKTFGLNETNEQYAEIGRSLRESKVDALGDLKQMKTGTLPTKEEYDKWMRISDKDLAEEQAKLLESFVGGISSGDTQFDNIVKERTDLSVKKQRTTRWIVLLQVAGLFLTQLGTILELKFRTKV